MKLRLADKNIIFRLENNEYQQLMETGTLSQLIPLPNEDAFCYKVIIGPAQSVYFASGELVLTLTAAMLNDLIKAPKKSGLTYQYPTKQGDVKVSLQLDNKACC